MADFFADVPIDGILGLAFQDIAAGTRFSLPPRHYSFPTADHLAPLPVVPAPPPLLHPLFLPLHEVGP